MLLYDMRMGGSGDELFSFSGREKHISLSLRGGSRFGGRPRRPKCLYVNVGAG